MISSFNGLPKPAALDRFNLVKKQNLKTPIRLFGEQTDRIIAAGKLVEMARKGACVTPLLERYRNFTEAELEEAAFTAAEKSHWHVVAQLALKGPLTTRTTVRIVNFAEKRGEMPVRNAMWTRTLNEAEGELLNLLMEAVDAGSPRLIDEVLRRGRFSPDDLGQAAIACCQKEGIEEIEQEMLLEKILEKSSMDRTSLNIALTSSLERGRTGLIRILLGPDGEVMSERAHNAAVQASDEGESLVSNFFDPEKDEGQALLSLMNWCYEKRGTEEYRNRLFAAGELVRAELDGEGVVCLSGLGLTSLPDCLHLFGDLKRLELDENNLTDLPENFFRCEGLKTLSLLGNPFPAMPASLVLLQSVDCKVFVPDHFNRIEHEADFVYVRELDFEDSL